MWLHEVEQTKITQDATMKQNGSDIWHWRCFVQSRSFIKCNRHTCKYTHGSWLRIGWSSQLIRFYYCVKDNDKWPRVVFVDGTIDGSERWGVKMPDYNQEVCVGWDGGKQGRIQGEVFGSVDPPFCRYIFFWHFGPDFADFQSNLGPR